jgi:hypothetical protein
MIGRDTRCGSGVNKDADNVNKPHVKDGPDRETANGSCRATRQLPAEPIRGLSTIQD